MAISGMHYFYLHMSLRYLWSSQRRFGEFVNTSVGRLLAKTSLSMCGGTGPEEPSNAFLSFVAGLSVSFSPLILDSSRFFIYQIRNNVADRDIFITDKGNTCLGPHHSLKGDTICYLEGFRLPVAMLKIENHTILIGTCYVAGMMRSCKS